MHPALYRFAAENFQFGSSESNELKGICAKAWDQWSTLPGKSPPEDFDCQMHGQTLGLGRAGGNYGATVMLEDNEYKIVPHNIEAPNLVLLTLIQLAYIEACYRQTL